jgi:hypothetical protein
MPVVIACPSCATKLKASGAGGRVVCPKCRHPFRYRAADDSRPEEEVEERITERPPAERRKRRDAGPEPPGKEPEERDDNYDREEPPPKSAKKKKKRKKKRLRLAPEEDGERETPAWIWWVAGGGGIVATLVTLLVVALTASPEGNLKFYAIVLLVTLPISTVIFFIAMILSNAIAEAVDIGEIHVAIIKAFGLLLVVNAISLFPYGNWAALLVWLVGLMVVFHLDFWEARILIVFNWGLNYAVHWFLIAALAGLVKSGG